MNRSLAYIMVLSLNCNDLILVFDDAVVPADGEQSGNDKKTGLGALYPGVKTARGSDESQEGTKIPAGTTNDGASSEIVAQGPVPIATAAPDDEFYVPTGSPEDKASIFSKLGFFYLDPLLWKARSKTLTQDDMWELSEVTKHHCNHCERILSLVCEFAHPSWAWRHKYNGWMFSRASA